MTTPRRQPHQPDERRAKITIGSTTVECSLRHYEDEKNALVIVTPSANTLAIYLQQVESIQGLARGLFQISTKTLIWVEHTVEDSRDIYTRVQNNAPVNSNIEQHTPYQRDLLTEVDLHHMIYALGYTSMDKEGKAS